MIPSGPGATGGACGMPVYLRHDDQHQRFEQTRKLCPFSRRLRNQGESFADELIG